MSERGSIVSGRNDGGYHRGTGGRGRVDGKGTGKLFSLAARDEDALNGISDDEEDGGSSRRRVRRDLDDDDGDDVIYDGGHDAGGEIKRGSFGGPVRRSHQ